MATAPDKKVRILIVDDEPWVRNLLLELLSESYECTTSGSAEDALSLLKQTPFDVVLSDINMGEGMSGLDMIPQVLALAPGTVVMMISGEQTIGTAIQALRVGAFDYITKPFDLQHVEAAVRRACHHHFLVEAKRRYENHLEELVEQRTAELKHLAYHDSLTDLPNRILFEDRLVQALSLARLGSQRIGVLFLSLDRFKKVSDTLGPALGYRLLKGVAERLHECIRGEGETVARFEGDEFALLLPQLRGTEDVIEIINDINEILRMPFLIDDHELFITVSIGISLFPDDGDNAQSLLKNAGAALYRAKEQGGNNYQFYKAEMGSMALKRLALENNLRRALDRSEFEVYYQPRVCVNTRAILGMEALVRWRHPDLGLIAPAEFIPLAEDTGLIVQIGEWVLRTACYQMSMWHDVAASLSMSVNLSARQFQQRNLSEMVIGILEETHLATGQLELELTESSIMKNADSAVKTLTELKEAGVKISIDDFGTGYSSLAYLKRLPIDTLKIDKSFVCDVTTNQDDAALIMAIITLAHNLRLKVTAEGVETEDQLKFLHLLRCDEWQGFLYSEPVSAQTFRQRFLGTPLVRVRKAPHEDELILQAP